MRINRVRELREELHLSQESLGNCVGISQQVISKIERDNRRLTKENLLILADFFNVSTDYLLGRSRERRNVEQERELLSRYERHYDLLQIYEMVGEKNQGLVRCLLDKMAEQEYGGGGQKTHAGDCRV